MNRQNQNDQFEIKYVRNSSRDVSNNTIVVMNHLHRRINAFMPLLDDDNKDRYRRRIKTATLRVMDKYRAQGSNLSLEYLMVIIYKAVWALTKGKSRPPAIQLSC
jgi:hypothetical protein